MKPSPITATQFACLVRYLKRIVALETSLSARIFQTAAPCFSKTSPHSPGCYIEIPKLPLNPNPEGAFSPFSIYHLLRTLRPETAEQQRIRQRKEERISQINQQKYAQVWEMLHRIEHLQKRRRVDSEQTQREVFADWQQFIAQIQEQPILRLREAERCAQQRAQDPIQSSQPTIQSLLNRLAAEAEIEIEKAEERADEYLREVEQDLLNIAKMEMKTAEQRLTQTEQLRAQRERQSALQIRHTNLQTSLDQIQEQMDLFNSTSSVAMSLGITSFPGAFWGALIVGPLGLLWGALISSILTTLMIHSDKTQEFLLQKGQLELEMQSITLQLQ